MFVFSSILCFFPPVLPLFSVLCTFMKRKFIAQVEIFLICLYSHLCIDFVCNRIKNSRLNTVGLIEMCLKINYNFLFIIIVLQKAPLYREKYLQGPESILVREELRLF